MIEIQPKPTRDGFGEELVKLGYENEKIIVLSADLEDSTRAEYFKFKFPDRFYNTGIAEQNMVGIAAGLAKEGFITFATSFAVFLTNRAYDFIRISICYNNLNVKLVASHVGVTVGEDGATAQSLEDVAIMAVLPNMRVLCPVDYIEAKKITRYVANEFGPFYVRLSRAPYPVLTSENDTFEFGKGRVFVDGEDLTIISYGITVSESIKASEELKKEGISARVVNLSTLKPLDEEVILKSAEETGAILVVEEHQVINGLGSMIARVLASKKPVPMEFVAVNDVFGVSGKPYELLEHFGLDYKHIKNAAINLMKRKKSSLLV
ncbi:MAG: transketolase family protein [Brevinematales bacterium]|nr:transketolase family protein [Brevinematales bacterium]